MGYDGSIKFDTRLDESGFNSGIHKLQSLVTGGMAVITGAVAGAAASFGALTVASLNEVASLEQNIGGVETLFKESADRVIENAKSAYKTAGLSANNYMSTVTSFSASLLQSLENDTEKAAEYADRAIRDMSDNANKMGTGMDLIQNAYQGFAKQNYTMLDNLKLGYGGTQKEMQRLIADAAELTDIQEKLGVTVDASSMSFGNIVNAISVMQEKMGIAGTTAKEAATTIEGSVKSMQSAWDNYLAGIGSADEFAEAFGVAAEIIIKNLGEIVPRLAATIPGLVKSIYREFSKAFKNNSSELVQTGYQFIKDLAAGVTESAPTMIESGAEAFAGFVNGIAERMPELVPKAIEIIAALAGTIIDNLPTIINAGIALLRGLIQGIIESLPLLIVEAPRIINDFASAIYSGLGQLVLMGLEMLVSLIQGLWDNRELLLDNAFEIFLAFLNVFSLSKLFSLGKSLTNNLAEGIKNLGPKVTATGKELLSNLVSGIKSLATHPVTTLKSIATNAMNAVKNIDWKSIGSGIIHGIASGLKNGVGTIITAARDAASSALAAAKERLGIHSPSSVFRDQVGKMMALGMGVGFENNIPVDDMTSGIMKSVSVIESKAANVTKNSSGSVIEKVAGQYITGDSNDENDLWDKNLQIVNVFEVDGTPLVEKTTTATLKKINSNQKEKGRTKGR